MNEDRLLDQIKVLKMKTKPTMLKYLTFALSLADVIEIIVSRNSTDEVSQIVGAVIIKNNFSEKQT